MSQQSLSPRQRRASGAWRGPIGLAVLVSILISASVAVAQVGSYDLRWWTVDAGGGMSRGGAYSLSGTIGQADAGVLCGGAFELTGGFWGLQSGAGPADRPFSVYLPFVVKN